MHIDDSILKAYLNNVYFINGTAYAGKSTVVRMIAERKGLIHCGENYGLKKFLSIATPDRFPNLCYFQTMSGWQEFVTRTPDEYAAWIANTADEIAQFEVAELMQLARDNKVIVDTNLSADLLAQISDYDHVVFMLAPQELSVNKFFDRSDPEKRFLLDEIDKTEDPAATLRNFREGLMKINSQAVHDRYLNSGFKCVIRHGEDDDIEEKYNEIVAHFGL